MFEVPWRGTWKPITNTGACTEPLPMRIGRWWEEWNSSYDVSSRRDLRIDNLINSVILQMRKLSTCSSLIHTRYLLAHSIQQNYEVGESISTESWGDKVFQKLINVLRCHLSKNGGLWARKHHTTFLQRFDEMVAIRNIIQKPCLAFCLWQHDTALRLSLSKSTMPFLKIHWQYRSETRSIESWLDCTALDELSKEWKS